MLSRIKIDVQLVLNSYQVENILVMHGSGFYRPESYPLFKLYSQVPTTTTNVYLGNHPGFERFVCCE